MILPDEEIRFCLEKSGIIDWVPTKISPPNSALFRHKNDCSSSPRCLPNVASQMMPLKVVTPLMQSNPTSLLVSSVLKPEPNEESMSTSELRLYRACISNGVDVSSWPVHEDAGYKDKIEKFRLLNRQARARVRRKVAPPSKSRQASLGEAAQPMDLSIPEDTSRMSSTGSIPLNPPIPPVVVANISGWVLPVQTPTVANKEPAANRFLLQNTSFPPVLPRPPMDSPAPSLFTSFLSSHIPLPTPPSSSSSSSVPSEQNHLQAPALVPDEPTTDNQLPPKPSSSPKAARKRKSTKPMRRLFLKDLVTPQTYTSPTASSTAAQTVLENKENQLPPANLPTDPQPATNTDNVTAAVSFPPQCKAEETSQEKEAPTKTGPTTEYILEVQTRVKMEPDHPSDYGHYKVVDRSPNRKSIRLKLKKILPGKGEDEPSGCTKATSPDQKMTCKICGEDCASFRGLRKHLRCQHPKVKEPTVCDMCGEDCGSLRRLRAHVRSQHPITKVHRCEVCNKEFTQECSLVYHLAFMHSRNSPYECQECHQKFVTDGWLRSHMAKEHASRIYPCTSCRYTFPTKVRLRMHIRRCHQGLKKIKCDLCEKRFATSAGLDLHAKSIHEGLKPYQCQVCQRRFTQPNVLKYHCVRFHAGILPLILGRTTEETPSASP